MVSVSFLDELSANSISFDMQFNKDVFLDSGLNDGEIDAAEAEKSSIFLRWDSIRLIII